MAETNISKRIARGAAAIFAVALLAGCASANKNATATSASTSARAASSSKSSGTSGMSGMSGTSGTATATATGGMTVNGVKAIPSQLLATADWQGMKIEARTMTAAPFLVYNGTSWHEIRATKATSFHLMVMLDDAHTGVPIPYASVWATIKKAGKVVYDEQQLPMLSAFMGPHYGNNVSLPGGGEYQLTLLVSPPLAARHLEYAHVWMAPHRVTTTFHWTPVP